MTHADLQAGSLDLHAAAATPGLQLPGLLRCHLDSGVQPAVHKHFLQGCLTGPDMPVTRLQLHAVTQAAKQLLDGRRGCRPQCGAETLFGTLMAVDPNAPKEDRFIALGGEPYLVRYNSRLPVVVYVPEGAEARYRIWSAEAETKTMEKG